MKITACLQWLWKETAHHRAAILANCLMGILRVSVSLFMVWVCKRLVDIATQHESGDIRWYVAALIVCLVLQLALSVAGSRLGIRQEIELRNRMRSRLFATLMRSRWNGDEQLHTGDMINRMEEDVPTVTGTLCQDMPYVVVTLYQLAGAAAFLFLLDARLMVVVVCIMPVALVVSKVFLKTMRRLSREIRTADSRLQVHLQEKLQHRILLRALEYIPYVERQLHSLQDDLQRKVMARTDFSLFSRIMVQGGFSVGYAIAFLWGVYGLLHGTVSFGGMTAFLQMVSQVQRPMLELSRQLPAFSRTMASVERIAELESFPEEEEGTPIRMKGLAGVRMENVCFAYPDREREVLHGFTHDFAPGSFTAIVGETGVGKSTLFRLILGLLSPASGRVVCYDAEHMEGVEMCAATRCNLSYVPQGNTLVSGTIRENLLMGNPDATDDELREALHVAMADFVYSLPDGWDTLCGEQGMGLSEGQAQRIALARGILRPGSILLLDEPTSALDSETAAGLLTRLSAYARCKTLIMITHSEQAATYCTSVVRMWK